MSPRFAPILCALAALALVPTVIHSYWGATVEDGFSAAAIPLDLGGATAIPSDRPATWGRRRFDSDDWIERRYVHGADVATLTVIRSRDLKALYHHPELAVAYGIALPHHDTRRIAARPAIPVHVLTSDTGAVALYVLQYADRYVEHPISFQFRTAFELLLSGRRTMTLFFARQDHVPPGTDLEDLPLARILFEAIDGFAATPSR